MGFFKDIKKAIKGESLALSSPSAPPGKEPSERSIYQARQNFGVNFGSLFVLEKYIFDSFFIDNTNYELDAVKALVKKDGIEETRRKFEAHWTTYCSDNDWNWLRDKGVQSIRIPIGYWIVAGGSFTDDTSFEKVKGVYENAWDILKSNYIEKAKEFNISILIDLHAVPKGANTGDHSGERFETPGFWQSHSAIKSAVDACNFMAGDLQQYDNISGIQIVNESCFDEHAKGQMKYYTKAVDAIRDVNKEIPIIISDGWWPDQWVKFLGDRTNGRIGASGIVIDHHVYRCFSEEDKSKEIDQIIQDLDGNILSGLSGEADFIIGEYSCVIDGQTWDRSNCNREEKVCEFGQRQSKIFKERAKAGTYFWTFKFEHGDGGEWGFKPMIERNCIPTRQTEAQIPSKDDYERVFNEHYEGHQKYWQTQNPNESYEFWRYKEGFVTGWADATAFAKFENSRIGRVVAWKQARLEEHIKARGESKFLWQWIAGFHEALSYFDSL